MRSADIIIIVCCVDTPSCAADDTAILEIVLKIAVVGEQQTRAAHSCQRKHMLIVGLANTLFTEFSRFTFNLFVGDAANYIAPRSGP